MLVGCDCISLLSTIKETPRGLIAVTGSIERALSAIDALTGDAGDCHVLQHFAWDEKSCEGIKRRLNTVRY